MLIGFGADTEKVFIVSTVESRYNDTRYMYAYKDTFEKSQFAILLSKLSRYSDSPHITTIFPGPKVSVYQDSTVA